ncbi:MarR family winged helix-turn-helix transcriptional regulator [Piscinibacter sakaiensis]|nr:MarR family transcriptional regulator [Piscinibacter sakaiensis]
MSDPAPLSHPADEAPPDAGPAFYDGRTYDGRASIGHLMSQIVAALRREVEQGMAPHGLTAAQWLPLWKLKLGSAGTAQELARQLDVDAGAMTRLLDRLEAKGLVARERCASDRRVVRLALTPAGEDVTAHIPAVLAGVQNRYLRGFSAEEWALLMGLLRRMLANTPRAAMQADPAASAVDPGPGAPPPADAGDARGSADAGDARGSADAGDASGSAQARQARASAQAGRSPTSAGAGGSLPLPASAGASPVSPAAAGTSR